MSAVPEVAVGTDERARGDGTEGGLSSHRFWVCGASLQASRRRRLLKLECELRGAGNRARVRGLGCRRGLEAVGPGTRGWRGLAQVGWGSRRRGGWREAQRQTEGP